MNRDEAENALLDSEVAEMELAESVNTIENADPLYDDAIMHHDTLGATSSGILLRTIMSCCTQSIHSHRPSQTVRLPAI
jgi:hypothetical protein